MISIKSSIKTLKNFIAKNINKLLNIQLIHIADTLVSGADIIERNIIINDKIYNKYSQYKKGLTKIINPIWSNKNVIVNYFTKNSDLISVDQSGTAISQNKGLATIGLKTPYGTFYKKIQTDIEYSLSDYFLLSGFQNNTLGKYIIDSFILSYNTYQNIKFPANDINYDNTWTGINELDIVMINTTQQYNNLLISNLNNPEARNKIFINKSVYPNTILKWVQPVEQANINIYESHFDEVDASHLYIIQNDGLVSGNTILSYPKYKHNPFFKYQNFDFSGMTVATSYDDNLTRRTPPGVLITKRHLLHARHLNRVPPIGTKVRFVSKTGAIIEKTIINRVENPSGHDNGVSLLDSEVPNDIKVYKIMPTIEVLKYYITAMPTISRKRISYNTIDTSNNSNGQLYGIVYFNTDQHKRAHPAVAFPTFIADLYDSWYKIFNLNYDSSLDAPSNFSTTGDSGSPMFVPFGDELIIAGLYDAPSMILPDHNSLYGPPNLNTMIASLGVSGYSAESLDLSSFNFSTYQV